MAHNLQVGTTACYVSGEFDYVLTGGDALYYGDQPGVSASSNIGTLAVGECISRASNSYIVSAGTSYVNQVSRSTPGGVDIVNPADGTTPTYDSALGRFTLKSPGAEFNVLDYGAINVLDYGAIGDGVHDDTEAIQAAATAAVNKVLWLPPTDAYYNLTTTIYVGNNTVVRGGNSGFYWGRGATVLIKSNGNTNGDCVLALGARCIVENIEFRGPEDITLIDGGKGWLRAVYPTSLTNNPSYGIRCDDNRNGTLSTGSVTLPVATIPVTSTAEFALSGSLKVGPTAAQTVTYTGKTATSFTGCAGGTGTFASGSRVAPSRDDGDTGAALDSTGNTRIYDCRFSFFAVAGVGGNMNLGAIERCHFRVNKTGVNLMAADDPKYNVAAGNATQTVDTAIRDNTFTHNIEYGIHCDGPYLAVENNRIEWNKRNGVMVESTQARITNNLFDRNGWAAVRVTGSEFLISGNFFRRNGAAGDGAFGINEEIYEGMVWATETDYYRPPAVYSTASDESHIFVGSGATHGTITGNQFIHGTDDAGKGSVSPKYVYAMENTTQSYVKIVGNEDSIGYRDNVVNDPSIVLTAGSLLGATSLTISSSQATNRVKAGTWLTITNESGTTSETKEVSAVNTGTGVLTVTALTYAHPTGDRIYVGPTAGSSAKGKRLLGTTGYSRPALPFACRVYSNAAITTTTGTSKILDFNTAWYDDDGMHSTTAYPSRITCKAPGLYVITANLSFDYAATGIRAATILLNGSTPIGSTLIDATSGSYPTIMNVSAEWQMNEGDYVELQALQGSGGNLDVGAASAYTPELAAVRIGD